MLDQLRGEWIYVSKFHLFFWKSKIASAVFDLFEFCWRFCFFFMKKCSQLRVENRFLLTFDFFSPWKSIFCYLKKYPAYMKLYLETMFLRKKTSRPCMLKLYCIKCILMNDFLSQLIVHGLQCLQQIRINR